MNRFHNLLAFAVVLLSSTPAHAQNIPAPYDRMNLTPEQAQQIRSYENEWRTHYTDLKPRMSTLQSRLNNMLSTPKVDPIEVTATQQRINQMREQLGIYATSTYLRKRQVLNDGQRQRLDGWMRGQFAGRGGNRHY
jgi:Spy/CpxP family protein refolding chaperone